MTALYDDGRISCDDEGVTIRRYYPWGSKRIRYSALRSVSRRPLTARRGRGRIWGSSDFVHWYNLDPDRSKKSDALELDVGGRVVPTITPDDPDEVERILTEHVTS